MDRQQHKVERRLAAIFAADVAGYSRLMERNEVETLQALDCSSGGHGSPHRRHSGRIANTAGDSILAEFPSAVDAVQCAIAVQEALTHTAQEMPMRAACPVQDRSTCRRCDGPKGRSVR